MGTGPFPIKKNIFQGQKESSGSPAKRWAGGYQCRLSEKLGLQQVMSSRECGPSPRLDVSRGKPVTSAVGSIFSSSRSSRRFTLFRCMIYATLCVESRPDGTNLNFWNDVARFKKARRECPCVERPFRDLALVRPPVCVYSDQWRICQPCTLASLK